MRKAETVSADEFLTLGDVAKAAGVVPATVRYWCDAKILASQRTASGVRLIRRGDAARVIAARKARRDRQAS